jgi:hypothetical protein
MFMVVHMSSIASAGAKSGSRVVMAKHLHATGVVEDFWLALNQHLELEIDVHNFGISLNTM